MKRALYIVPLLLLLLHTPGHAQQPQGTAPLVDTVRLNAMRDTIQWRLNQLLDIDMLTACLQVRKLENVHGLSLLGPNEPLRDTIAAFERGYATGVLVHSFVNSNQFWPKTLFDPHRLARDIADPKVKPAVGFDVSFTPQGDSSQRRFAVSILSASTPGLLSQAQSALLDSTTQQGVSGPFARVKPAATDSVNTALFRGIAQLRAFWEQALASGNIKRVSFAPAENPRFGFSELPHELVKAHYGSITVRGREYGVPWQSLAVGSSEPVTARVELLSGDTASHPVQFRSSRGAAVTPVRNPDGSYTVTLSAGSAGSTETLEAFYTDTLPGNRTQDVVVGALRAVSYAPVQRTVIPVILNGAKLSVNTTTLAETLNGVYRQAAVTWSVKPALELSMKRNEWDVEEEDGKLLIATSMFNRYSAEMQAIVDATKRLGGYDPEAYYLIVTDLPNTLGYQGYMPLKSEFAFIFTQGQDNAYRVMAHELGHGAFYLKHPQDEYRILEATDNLMDKYDIGLNLWKPQWDWVGDPSFRLYMFQQEEDGASVGLGDLVSDIDDSYLSWTGSLLVATPSGKSIQLPNNVSEIGFVSKHLSQIPLGSAVRFKTSDGNQYAAFYNFAQNNFEGYGLIKKNPQGLTGKDLIEKDSVGNLIFWKNPTETPSKAIAGVPTTCNINVKQLDEGQVQGLPINSKGEDALKGRNFYIDAKGQVVKVIKDTEACIVPPALNITQQTLLENADKVIFNPYGKGGLLVNYKTQAGSTFIYIGFNADATEYYLQWFGNEWVEWTPQPWQQIQFGDIILSIVEVCKYLIGENPQEFLDAVGSSPSIIAPFADGVNAIWFAFKGEWKMAGISAISIVPVIGDGVGASLKATVKIGQKYQTLHLVGEGAELILKTGKRFQNLSNKVVDEALVALGIAINKYGTHLPVLAKIADKVAGPAQLRTIIRAIDDMPDAQREIFFMDLSENANFASAFFAKVGDNPGLVESWKYFKNGNVSDGIRTSTEWLQKLSDDLDNTKYGLKQLFDDTPSDIAIWKELKENPYSKLDFIEETTDPQWLKWKDREFFKAVTEKGRTFNKHMKPRIKADLQAKGVDLTGTKQIDEFHVIGENGNKVIMDNAFVKEVLDENGFVEFYKVIYNDNKFGNLSSWTPNQNAEVINYFKNNPGKEYITMEVRTSNDLMRDAGITTIKQGDKIRLYRQDVFKTLSNGDNSNPVFKEIINMNAVNFAD